MLITRADGPCILIIEDNEDILEVIAMWLGSAGYKVHCAADEKTAVDFLRQNSPDAIIMDWFLGESFPELLDHLTKQKLLQRVVLCSGIPRIEEKMQIIGAAFALRKPFDLCDLEHMVRTIAKPTTVN